MPGIAFLSAHALLQRPSLRDRLMGRTLGGFWLPLELAEYRDIRAGAAGKLLFLRPAQFEAAIAGLDAPEIEELVQAIVTEVDTWSSRAVSIAYASERDALMMLLEDDRIPPGDAVPRLERMAAMRAWRFLADMPAVDLLLHVVERLYAVLARLEALAKEDPAPPAASFIAEARGRLRTEALRMQTLYALESGTQPNQLPHAVEVFEGMYIEPADDWLRDWLDTHLLEFISFGEGIAVVTDTARLAEVRRGRYTKRRLLPDDGVEAVHARTIAQRREQVRASLESRQTPERRLLALILGEMADAFAELLVAAGRGSEGGAIPFDSRTAMLLLRQGRAALSALRGADERRQETLHGADEAALADLEWLAVLCAEESAAEAVEFIRALAARKRRDLNAE